jgi:hypothetical protein
MVGDNDTTFRPMDAMKAQEVNSMLLRALGYTDVAWADVNAKAEEMGIAVVAADASLVLRGEGFKAIRTALDKMPMGAEVTFGEQLALTGYEPPYVAPEALEVVSFEMTNYKEAVVKFNVELDDETVLVENFVSSDDDHEIDAVELLEDNMTVVLTLKDTEELAAYGELEVVINDVVSTDEMEIAEDTTVNVEFVVDLAVPTVVSVEAVGNSGIKVTYSEPVNHTASITNYYLNGKLFAGSETISGNVSTLAVSADMAADVHELTVRASKVKDFADLYVAETTVEFVVEEDSVAPTAQVTSATQTEVVVLFSEAIESATVVTSAGTIDSQTWSDDKTELTIAYQIGSPLPVNGATLTVTDATDAYGNVASEFELSTGNPTIDLTRPEVTDVVVEGQDYILVYFSEDVTLDGTFKLVDADDAETALADAFYIDDDGDTHNDILKLTGVLVDGTYTLDITGVIDATPLANGLVPTVPSVVIPDATAVAIDTIYFAGQQLFVMFDDEVDAATAIDSANYSFIDANDAISKAFTANETFALLDDGKTVSITFSDEADTFDRVDVDALQVKSVQDLAGNTMTTEAIAVGAFVAVANAPQFDTVEVTGENTLVLSMNQGTLVAESIAPTDFVIMAGATEISVIDVAYSADDAEITLTINADLDALGQYGGNDLDVDVAAADVQAADVFGVALDTNTGAAITSTEAILPTVAIGDLVDGATDIVLTFDEAMEINNVDLNGIDLAAGGQDAQFLVFVNDVLVAQVSNDGTAVDTITIVVGALSTDDVVKVNYYNSPTATLNLTDVADNTIANFTLTTTVE